MRRTRWLWLLLRCGVGTTVPLLCRQLIHGTDDGVGSRGSIRLGRRHLRDATRETTQHQDRRLAARGGGGRRGAAWWGAERVHDTACGVF